MVTEYKIRGEGLNARVMIAIEKVMEVLNVKNITYEKIKDPTEMTKEEYYKMLDESSKSEIRKISFEDLKKEMLEMIEESKMVEASK